MIMKVLILLSSILILHSCKKDDIIFKDYQFEKELNNFIKENEEPQKIIYLYIIDGKDLYDDVDPEDFGKTFLLFYFGEPSSCNGFYKSFEYKGKQILLYDFSDKIKFSDLLDIQKGENICNSDLLIDYANTTIFKQYYFNNEKKLIEIKRDGSQRVVE